MTKYIRADGINKQRFNLAGLPRGVPQRLLTFSGMTHSLDRIDWNYAIACDQYLTDAERLLGIQIVNHLNPKDGRCHPSQEMLAARLGVTNRTIVDRLKQIKGAGWLVRQQQSNLGPKRPGRPANEYLPAVPAALLEVIQAAFPELNKVKPRVHLNAGELSEGRTQNKVKPRLHPNRQGIDNKKEEGLSDEERGASGVARDCFVEAGTPEWSAWQKVKSFPEREFRVEGRIKRGWYFPSPTPTAETAEKPNGGSAPPDSLGGGREKAQNPSIG